MAYGRSRVSGFTKTGHTKSQLLSLPTADTNTAESPKSLTTATRQNYVFVGEPCLQRLHCISELTRAVVEGEEGSLGYTTGARQIIMDNKFGCQNSAAAASFRPPT